jgi:hypothetical protein
LNRPTRLVISAAGCLLTLLAATPELDLSTSRGTPREQRTLEQVRRLAAAYDLGRFTKTRVIVIEEGAMAHAYPVLTMNCRFRDDDDLALSQFVHEQAHWVLQPKHRPRRPALLGDLKRLVPGLPTRYPAGGGDELSTYYHLPVIVLEWQAMEDLVGADRARRVMEWKREDHYTAIYAAALEHRQELEAILTRHDVRW